MSGKRRKPQGSNGGRAEPAKARTQGDGAEASRANLYDEVMARIIGELAAGRFQPKTGKSPASA